MQFPLGGLKIWETWLAYIGKKGFEIKISAPYYFRIPKKMSPFLQKYGPLSKAKFKHDKK